MSGYVLIYDHESDMFTKTIFDITIIKAYITPTASRICNIWNFRTTDGYIEHSCHPSTPRKLVQLEQTCREVSRRFGGRPEVLVDHTKTTKQVLQFLCDMSAKNRKIPIVSHSHDRDVESMPEFKSTVWTSMGHVCSQQFLTTMCPRFWDTHRFANIDQYAEAIAREGSNVNHFEYRRDQKLSAIVRTTLGRTQEHTSLQDCIDLFDVLTVACSMDNVIIPPKGIYMNMKFNHSTIYNEERSGCQGDRRTRQA
jgi:hypothetical protein